MSLNIYRIERSGGYDGEPAGHVVVARDEAAARRMATAASDSEGKDPWLDERSTVTLLGTASEGITEGIQLTDNR